MAEQAKRESESTKQTGKHIWIYVIFSVLIAAAAIGYLNLSQPSVDERLAAIEASRAIPDSENAAILYDRILQDPNASLNNQPTFLDPNSAVLTRSQPWTANDYPKIAVWIKKHEWLINKLMKVSQFEKCQFPLIVEPNRSIQVNRLRTMRKWRFLLCSAANNDVGEGRIDDAIAKWQCMIQIGKHLRQQSQLIEYLEGTAIEAVAAHLVIDFLVEGNASENQLRKIESFNVQTQDDWAAILDRILPVEELGEKKFKRQLSLIDRLKYEFCLGQFKSRKDIDQIAHWLYLRMLVIRRGMYIMVALRRYKNEEGHWPQTLDEIKPWVAEGILIDPQNNGPYVYQNTQDGFRLYGIGPNGRDENGQYKWDGPDDCPIWPPRQRDKTP